MKIFFVINPKSGRRDGLNFEAILSDKSRQLGFEFIAHRLKPQDRAEDLFQEIARYHPNIVAAAGGDGTINFMAGILAGTAYPLLIIPQGSANGMARELGISNLEASFALIQKGITWQIDLVDINGKRCLHLADVGLNARVVKRFEQDTRRGLLTYAKHLFSEIFLIKTYRFYLTIEDRPMVVRKAVSLTFANASKYGTGAVINPTGKLDDQRFELVIIKPFPRIKLLSIAWKMFTGKLNTSEYVEVISCTRARILSKRSTTLQIDGEVIGKVKEISVSISPKRLTVIVPENSLSN